MVLREENLCIKTSGRDELEELEQLFEEAVEFFDDDTMGEILHPADCMRGLDLPEGGRAENYELLSIYVADIMVGYAAVYRDYPRKEWVQLPFFYIGEKARGKGLGSRALKLIKRYFREANYRTMRVLCSLKNINALHFLFGHGFETVLCISENERRGYAGIGLECSLGARWEIRY